MGDEFQSGICGGSGGNWWNNPSTSKNVFGSSPCSSVIINSTTDHNMGIRGYGSAVADEPCSASDGSIIFHDIQKPQPPPDMVVGGGGGGGGSMDSTLQMMCIGLSSSTTTDWDHESLLNGKGEGNYHHHMLQEEPDSSTLNYGQENGDWVTPKNFTTSPQDSSIKSLNQLGFSITSSDECNTEGLATSFPMSTSANSYVYPSTTLLQTIFDTDSSQASQSQFDSSLVNYPSNNYRTKLNEFSPSFPKFSSFLKSSLQQKPQSDHLPFYNMASAGAQNNTLASFFPLMQSQFHSSSFEEKPSFPNLTRKANNEEVGDSGSIVKKSCTTNEPAFKRPRIQAPSPLPTFKVRKEKLGDRITALQQLVSPFGKTDTASVLHEAIEYIKLLHDQVHVLSTPYLKNGCPLQLQQTSDKARDNSSDQGTKRDLRNRGLCLVPISSTFPVAAETSTTPDFWAPTFGATFR